MTIGEKAVLTIPGYVNANMSDDYELTQIPETWPMVLGKSSLFRPRPFSYSLLSWRQALERELDLFHVPKLRFLGNS
jgi:hypothetical protein